MEFSSMLGFFNDLFWPEPYRRTRRCQFLLNRNDPADRPTQIGLTAARRAAIGSKGRTRCVKFRAWPAKDGRLKFLLAISGGTGAVWACIPPPRSFFVRQGRVRRTTDTDHESAMPPDHLANVD
jgi:hypothetical protein